MMKMLTTHIIFSFVVLRPGTVSQYKGTEDDGQEGALLGDGAGEVLVVLLGGACGEARAVASVAAAGA